MINSYTKTITTQQLHCCPTSHNHKLQQPQSNNLPLPPLLNLEPPTITKKKKKKTHEPIRTIEA